MKKTVPKSMDDGASRTIIGKEVKSISKLTVLSSMMIEVQYNPVGPGISAILGT